VTQPSDSPADGQTGCERATDDLIRRISASVHGIQKQVAASRAEIVRTRELLDRLGPCDASASSDTCVGLRWQLKSSRLLTAICTVSEEAPGLFRLVVNGGDSEAIVEDFASARSAAKRASQMAVDLIRLGWIEQPVT